MIQSYPSIYSLGHRLLEGLFCGDVYVQEKVDGSQLSVMRKDGKLFARSKGAEIDADAPPALFKRAIEGMKERFELLREGSIYRGECLDRPKHNALTYDRVPKGNFVLFDVQESNQAGGDEELTITHEQYISPADAALEAIAVELEFVPTFYQGQVTNISELMGFMERESFLGGPKIEGIVIKNYERFGPDKKPLFGKHVSEAFKEVHRKDWKEKNPTKGDVMVKLLQELTTEARWRKAIQHLKEQDLLTNSPKDIGLLVKAIQEDVIKEEASNIAEMLYKWAEPQVRMGVVKGFAQFYKQLLLEECGLEKDVRQDE